MAKPASFSITLVENGRRVIPLPSSKDRQSQASLISDALFRSQATVEDCTGQLDSVEQNIIMAAEVEDEWIGTHAFQLREKLETLKSYVEDLMQLMDESGLMGRKRKSCDSVRKSKKVKKR